jgi:hypothetical protein
VAGQTLTNQALLAPNDPTVLAVTSEEPVTAPVPRVPLRDIGALGDFVLAHAMSGGAQPD